MSSIADNVEATLAGIAAAAERAGRSPDEIHLLAVTKKFSPEIVREAIDAGLTRFGENRVQEALAKIPELPSNLEWHLIGHLQSNKVRKVLPYFDVVQTIDSLDLARRVDRIAAEEGFHPRVLIQVNIADDSAKYGFSAEGLRIDMDSLLELERLQIEGLMTIPAFDPDPEKTRSAFAALRELRDELEETCGCPFPVLSMGMSHDYGVAIEEGATIVRVGTALFGKRGG